MTSFNSFNRGVGQRLDDAADEAERRAAENARRGRRVPGSHTAMSTGPRLGPGGAYDYEGSRGGDGPRGSYETRTLEEMPERERTAERKRRAEAALAMGRQLSPAERELIGIS
jgi:hypothetical protein